MTTSDKFKIPEVYKTYTGFASVIDTVGRDVGVNIWKGALHDKGYLLPLYTEYVNHSPDGFNWGYEGSGPAQLAFALLMDLTNNPALTRRLYQTFKHKVIAKFNQHGEWRLKESQIREFIAKHSPIIWGDEASLNVRI